jgi:Pyridine nucleotide-disulphide oxidoreductase
VAVVGAGNSAAQAALDLAQHCDRVTMIVRGRRLSGSLSAYLCARIEGDPRIDVRLETEVTAVAGDGRLEAITLNAGEELPADALIVSIGGRPRTHWAAEQNLVIDDGGYLVTGHDLLEHGRPPRSWGLERPPPVTFLDCADVSGDARFELPAGRLWRGPPHLCRFAARQPRWLSILTTSSVVPDLTNSVSCEVAPTSRSSSTNSSKAAAFDASAR